MWLGSKASTNGIQLPSKDLRNTYKEVPAGLAKVDKSFKNLTHTLKASQEKSLRKFKTEDSDGWRW